MPRLTNRTYYERYVFLRQLWLEKPWAFVYLDAAQQQEVHRYYQPAEDMTKAQLIAHRHWVTVQDHSLPSRASKLYLRIERGVGLPHNPPLVVTIEDNIVTEVIPFEVRKVARALIRLAEWQLKQAKGKSSEQ